MDSNISKFEIDNAIKNLKVVKKEEPNNGIKSQTLPPIAKRIEKAKEFRAQKIGQKISWSALATAIGLTVTAPNNWKKGKISRENLEKIAEYTETDFAWLVTGEGEMAPALNKARTALGYITGSGLGAIATGIALRATAGPIGLAAGAITASAFDAIGKKISNTKLQKAISELKAEEPDLINDIKQEFTHAVEKQLTNNISNFQKVSDLNVRIIPVISFSQAGTFKDAIMNTHDEYIATYTEKLSEDAFALEIAEDSMLPEFKQKDKIIVDPDISPAPGDYVIARNGDDEATFKKYRPRGFDATGREYFELVSLNENYPSLDSRFQDIVIIATVIDHIRPLR